MLPRHNDFSVSAVSVRVLAAIDTRPIAREPGTRTRFVSELTLGGERGIRCLGLQLCRFVQDSGEVECDTPTLRYVLLLHAGPSII